MALRVTQLAVPAASLNLASEARFWASACSDVRPPLISLRRRSHLSWTSCSQGALTLMLRTPSSATATLPPASANFDSMQGFILVALPGARLIQSMFRISCLSWTSSSQGALTLTWRTPLSARHPAVLPCYINGSFQAGTCIHACLLLTIISLQEEPSELDTLFSRGIDPDVEDPTKCHSHPDVPSSWPAKPEIVAYVQQVSLLLRVW